MLDLTTLKKSTLLFCLCTSFLTGLLVDYSFGNQLDYWIHDSAIVFRHRTAWNHSGIVVLDEAVPFSVGRKQALPLFARATERLIEAGAKGVFLDARISKEIEGRMPYARCIEQDGSVQWSTPECTISSNHYCRIDNSELGNAPLSMNKEVIKSFRIAPFLDEQYDLPDFLLFGWEATDAIPPEGLVVSDRLVSFDNPIARWLDLSTDHAVYKLVEYSQPARVEALFKGKDSDDVCDYGYPCRRLRLSVPLYKVAMESERLILPVSLLASCDISIALEAASLMRDKVAVLQTTSPSEPTDILVTAMTTALLGPKLMTPGAQYIVDEVETILNQDSPQPPAYPIKILIFISIAIISVLTGVFFRQLVLWFTGLVISLVLIFLCFLNPITQLWPVVSTMLVYFVGGGQIIIIQLMTGFKEGKIVRQYLPTQIHKILMTLKKHESFESRRCHVAILMSDLAGYTTVTGLLKEPELVLELMNDYLEETTLALQKKHDGILEAYLGDMVCYYWTDVNEKDRLTMYKKALLGAIELRELQKKFFLALEKRYHNKIDEKSLKSIQNIIDAGIGVTVGNVVMGNLGPLHGIKKFGILGDPLNLVSRIESLTRLFNTDIIIAGDFLDAVKQSGLVVRKLGTMKVKGRLTPETLYALGDSEDQRFEQVNIEKWTRWLEDIELNKYSNRVCPNCFQKDKNTLDTWNSSGLLGDDGVWYLDEK